MKLLAIDDLADNLVSLTALMRSYFPGCEMQTALSGREGIEKARVFQPDTILLDIQMPVMDGFEVCRALKRDPATSHIPVIFLTAQTTEAASRIKGLEIGGDAFLTKPIDPGELMAQVKAMVRIKQAEDLMRDESRTLERVVAERTAALRASEAEFRQLNAGLEKRVCERTAQLEAANKELEAFSYSVSHDLRAPLRAIEGFSGIVVEDYRERLDDEGRRLLGVIRANAQRMSQLIDDLLVFSRTGRSEMRCSRLDMREMARSVFVEIVGDLGARARIDFTVGDLPAAEGDASLLRQVWVNLLSNAVKFSAQNERPAIEVTGFREGDEIVYHVRDNGVGFDMRYADKLFGVFQRLHPASEFEGTGIGLALVQRIIDRHGGRVWALGAVGQGATFSLSLPTNHPESLASPGLSGIIRGRASAGGAG